MLVGAQAQAAEGGATGKEDTDDSLAEAGAAREAAEARRRKAEEAPGRTPGRRREAGKAEAGEAGQTAQTAQVVALLYLDARNATRVC